MKVYFNNLDKTRLHSFYGELLANPPVGYINLEDYENRGESNSTKKSITFKVGRLVLKTLDSPAISIVNTDADLIHSAGSIPISKTPYVIDFEHIMALAGFDNKKFNSKRFRAITKRLLENERCRKIMPWSKAAKESLFSTFDSEIIRNKTEVVYPAIRLPQLKAKNRNRKKMIALFVAHNPNKKGMKFLNNIPKDVELRIVTGVPRKTVMREFSKADVFVYPSVVDTFGMVLLEAMAWGLPIICIDDFCTKEIVNDNAGFVIDGLRKKWFEEGTNLYRDGGWDYKNVLKWAKFDEDRISIELNEKLAYLKRKQIRMRLMGKNGRGTIKRGKFSIEYRNKQLRRIYNKSIKK